MMTIVTGVNMNKNKKKISMREKEVKAEAKVEVEAEVGTLKRIYLVAHSNDMIIINSISEGDPQAGKNFLTNSFLFTLPM